MTVRSSFFVLIGHKIAILTYYHSYLQLLTLNNGTGEIFMKIGSSFFCHAVLHNDNTIPKKFTITSVIPNRTTF